MKKLNMILCLALILCFMVGCQDKEAMRAQGVVEEANKEIVKCVFEEMNKGNIEIINELYAPDYGYYSPSNNPKPMSREETIEFLKMVLKAFPDVNWRIKEIIAKDDRVIVRFIVTGTHHEEFQGILATGNKIEVSTILIWRIINSKIVEEREEANILGMMQQLGMELKPKEEEK
jgi:C-1 hydroxylase